MKTIEDVMNLLESKGVIEMNVGEPKYRVKLVCMELTSLCNNVIHCKEIIQNFDEKFIKVVVEVYHDLGIGSVIETPIVLNVKEVLSIEEDGIVVKFHKGFDSILFNQMNELDEASGIATKENPGKFCEIYKIVIEKITKEYTNIFSK